MDKMMQDQNKTLVTVNSATSPISPLWSGAEQYGPILPKRYRWRPTFWRIQPLIGMLALVLTIICLLVSFAILQASHGHATINWDFQPTVYLAIATAVSNTALSCALALAAPISWWYKALRGSTVMDLELDWKAGQSFPRALISSIRYRRMFSLFSMASLATSLVLIDGPLLQRSSSVKRVITTDNVHLNMSVATQFPEGFSAYAPITGGFAYTPAAINVFN